MTSGLTTTFDVLARTDNQAAMELLVGALGHAEPAIARGALAALLSRPGPPGQREILRLYARMDEPSRALIRQQPGCLADALRDAVLGHDRELFEIACAVILELREYDLHAALRTALADTLNPNAALAAAAALSLCELLHDELEARPDFRPHRDPRQIRLALLNGLEVTVQRFAIHKRPEPLEAFLLLAKRDNPVLLEILHEPRHPSYVALINRLTHSDRQAVMDLVLSYLTKVHAPSAALTVIAHRRDLPFINRLLRLIASEPAASVAHNLARIESFVWLRREATQLDELDDTLQEAAVKLVMATGIKRLAAFEVVSHFIERGKPGGRRAAAAALAGFHGAVANQLALRAIKDIDPLVQAAAVPQLRERGIPGALAMLIEYLASPHPPVRDAARESLAEFSLDRFFAAFEMLSDDVRRTTGAIVRRVDPSTIPRLRAELQSASRRRQVRAVQVALAMEAVPLLEEDVLRLLAVDDPLVRAEAARSLVQSNSSAVRQGLSQAALDTSGAVREAAMNSLLEIARRTARLAEARVQTPQANDA